MGLQEDLKARTSALISQQMANWVVEIQRAIQEHQASLVRALDELGETAARYDEKIDEQEIGAAMAEVVARQPPPPPAADYAGLKASIAAIEKGASLAEVLTLLVTESNRRIERVAMFIVKNNGAMGWYGRGFERPEVVKTLNIPLTADTVFRVVSTSRHATRGHVSHSPGTAQALARLAGEPQGILAVPLILRDKVAAVLYCDTRQEEVPGAIADTIEILVTFAGKVIDLLSAGVRPPSTPPQQGGSVGNGGTPGGGASVTPPGAGAPTTGSGVPSRGMPGAVTPSGGTAGGGSAVRPRPSAPPAVPVESGHVGSETVMWPGNRDRVSPPSAPPTPVEPARPGGGAVAVAVSPQEQKAHDDAKRFARLVVSEIKLYNEAKVAEGRRTKDIYERLKEDIERGRQMYAERVSSDVRRATDYFKDELVRILAGGDPTALGSM